MITEIVDGENDPDCDPDRDGHLIKAVRSGDREVFSELYERYAPPAYRFACKLLGSVQGADDLVAEAFAKVFERVVAGGGPTKAFRAYLLTTIRTTWYKQLAAERMVDRQVTPADLCLPTTDRDRLVEQLEVHLASEAFASLPDRWRTVLWHLEIEGKSAAVVAELLGLQTNAVAALAFRARDGLRVAYIQRHARQATRGACRESTTNMAAWLCGRLNDGLRFRIGVHLDNCERCADSAREVSELLTQIRRLVPLTVRTSVSTLQ